MERGDFRFEVSDDGTPAGSAQNVQGLRRLWLDRLLINGDALGPGDPGDFDNGAWHVACHLAGAGGVCGVPGGGILWLEISHDPMSDLYYASVTGRASQAAHTVPIESAEGRLLLDGANTLGFVEGNSLGRTSARRVHDSPTLFNLWRRQDFDQPLASAEDGGKVWEHWCTLRDIRPEARIGTCVLTAYVSLIGALGDAFVPTVARGRREYGHPDQLRAMVRAGLVGEKSAVLDIAPRAIPGRFEAAFLQASPAAALEAAEQLDWSKPLHYYMFARKLKGWSTADAVKRDLAG